jgi:DNA-binding transcriptional LysR family regulator
MGMGVGILYRNAIASRVAKGNLKIINVPELKEMGIKSFVVYDKRKPLAPMAQEFLQILREKANLPIASNDKRIQIGSARSLSLH